MSYFDDNEDWIVYGRGRARRRSPRNHGTPAEPGSPLARARIAAHSAFDPLWQSGKMTRSAAYSELARRLGIPKSRAHMQMFDIATCEKVVALFLVDEFDVIEDDFKDLI
jgi:hypothetical protein